MKQLIGMISDGFNYHVLRTDISSFFESIPHDRLLRKLKEDQLLSQKSLRLISGILFRYARLAGTPGIGLPRGLGISSYLSELYMRDFDQRVKAVSHFRELEAAESLAAANKRVGNILAKFDGELAEEIDLALLQEDAEKALAESVEVMTEALEPAFATGNYQEALSKLADLREPVDAFFDNVMVMADDEALKKNRLTLLNNLRNLFLQVADISVLQK